MIQARRYLRRLQIHGRIWHVDLDDHPAPRAHRFPTLSRDARGSTPSSAAVTRDSGSTEPKSRLPSSNPRVAQWVGDHARRCTSLPTPSPSCSRSAGGSIGRSRCVRGVASSPTWRQAARPAIWSATVPPLLCWYTTVEVSDDGVGGADPARGSGLRGIADRVAALGGTMTLDSPTGLGTRLVAELPCG
jgi:hypothetical protein